MGPYHAALNPIGLACVPRSTSRRDALWRWASPAFPARFSGEEGIALVRDGDIVAHLTINAWRAWL